MKNNVANLNVLFNQIALENVYFNAKTPIANDFIQMGIDNLYAAIEYVYRLPYRPPSDPFNWHLVLQEHCATCSTKHSLLVALANEIGVSFELGNAIYEMSAENFPVLSKKLEEIGLSCIPESHNFIFYNSYMLDVTFPGACKILQPKELVDISIIAVSALVQIKTEWYPKYLQKWLQQHNPRISLDEYRAMHEQCVKILGDECYLASKR